MCPSVYCVCSRKVCNVMLFRDVIMQELVGGLKGVYVSVFKIKILNGIGK